ncbi:hypothetical protein ACFP9V_20735 [Deinococcus radiopugnans]|uniref:hypothetical protein n=1 Tax=Deinococcus radiopugnans TaxID=57497 RepID=UPI00360AD35D
MLARFARAAPIIDAEAARDLDGSFPAAALTALREAGLLSAVLPTQHGGWA